MPLLTGYSILSRFYHYQILNLSRWHRSYYRHTADYFFICSCANCVGHRWFSTRTGSISSSNFDGLNAYDLLGVSETSSFAEIKASFRKLAKETHPDLAQSPDDSSVGLRFVQILAAYEILSDSEKRALYDSYLLSQINLVQRHSRQGSTMYKYASQGTETNKMEVVEWLKWYRSAVNDILLERRVVVGSGYFDVLERDFYSAVHAAYYGPEIESMDFLPDCFEAEERSEYGTSEVLHLVSGRDLFGMVSITENFPELSSSYSLKLTPLTSAMSGLCQSAGNESTPSKSEIVVEPCQMNIRSINHCTFDAYKNLELHVSGKVVAVASRIPPKDYNGVQSDDSQDHIHVYLSPNDDPKYEQCCAAVGSGIPLGKISGLGTSPDEGSCFVYNNSGIKTHVIMKHRTLLVKHMHWYRLGDKVSVCECRCSRARLPPSRFWLFEPRCGKHDIGGWYVETFGRDKKGRNFRSQRYWDGLDSNELSEKRLHPAIYLLALAYRTLDIEDSKRRKQTVRNTVEGKMRRILSWCKKLV